MLNGGSTTFYNAKTVVADTTLSDWNPRVSWGNNVFYLVWVAVTSSGNWDVRGKFLTQTMTAGPTADPDLTAGDKPDYPDVSYCAKALQFLAAWTTRTVIGAAHVKARRVSATSQTVQGGLLTVDQGSLSTSHVCVGGAGANGSSEWLLMWDELTSTTSCNVKGRRIKSDGTFPASAFTLGNTTWPSWTTHGSWPAIAWDTDGSRYWYVLWRKYVPAQDSFSLQGRAVDNKGGVNKLGLLTDTLLVAGSSLDCEFAACVYDKTNDIYLVGFWDTWVNARMKAQRFTVPNNPF
jgi:hypothetical protein